MSSVRSHSVTNSLGLLLFRFSHLHNSRTVLLPDGSTSQSPGRGTYSHAIHCTTRYGHGYPSRSPHARLVAANRESIKIIVIFASSLAPPRYALSNMHSSDAAGMRPYEYATQLTHLRLLHAYSLILRCCRRVRSVLFDPGPRLEPVYTPGHGGHVLIVQPRALRSHKALLRY